MHSVFTCFSTYLLRTLYFMYKSTPNTALDSSLVLTVNLSHIRLRSLEDLIEYTSYSFVINCWNSLEEPTVASELDLLV
jgi:hypothetical protein